MQFIDEMSNDLSSFGSEQTATKCSRLCKQNDTNDPLSYYDAVLRFKKRFVKNLESHCDKRREIYKIWAHWLIRTLSRRNNNPHPLIRVEDENPDEDIIKHMQHNGITRSRAMTTYTDLVNQYNMLYSVYGEEHESMLKNHDLIRELQKRFRLTYLSSGGIYFLGLEEYGVNIKLTPDKFYRLRDVYIGPSDLFLFYLFEYAFNYYLLDGKSLQWSIPKEVFDSLAKHDLRGELFASPVNKYCSTFYSLFEVDRLFSSQGNFFSLSTDLHVIPGGLYEVNPPFIEEIFTKSTQLILDHLKLQTEPLGFIYIMPRWIDLEGYTNLKNSKYYAGELVLEKSRHCYFQSSNNKHIMASFETVVIVVGNDRFIQKHRVEDILESVKTAFTDLMKPKMLYD